MSVIIWPSSSNCSSLRSHSLFSIKMRLCLCSLTLNFFLQSLTFLNFYLNHTVLLCCFIFPSQPSSCRLEKELTQYKLNFPPFLPPHGPSPKPSEDDKRKNLHINIILSFLRALKKGGEDPSRIRKS